jgi:hypothetical protein
MAIEKKAKEEVEGKKAKLADPIAATIDIATQEMIVRAQKLGIEKEPGVPNAVSLAIGGSANSRILRTTQKHSYSPGASTLYIMGMTFVSRLEIPILTEYDEFEGRWTNPQNQQFRNRWMSHWKQSDTDQFVNLKLKWEADSILDRTEDLMYQMWYPEPILLVHDCCRCQ